MLVAERGREKERDKPFCVWCFGSSSHSPRPKAEQVSTQLAVLCLACLQRLETLGRNLSSAKRSTSVVCAFFSMFSYSFERVHVVMVCEYPSVFEGWQVCMLLFYVCTMYAHCGFVFFGWFLFPYVYVGVCMCFVWSILWWAWC